MTGVITDFLSVVNNQVLLLKHKHSAYTHIFPLKCEIIKSQLATTVVPGQLNDASLNHEPSTVDAAAAVPETAGRRCCAGLW